MTGKHYILKHQIEFVSRYFQWPEKYLEVPIRHYQKGLSAEHVRRSSNKLKDDVTKYFQHGTG